MHSEYNEQKRKKRVKNTKNRIITPDIMDFIELIKGFSLNNNDNYWLINMCVVVKYIDLV